MKKVYTDEQLDYIKGWNLEVGNNIFVRHKSRIKHMSHVLGFSWAPGMNKFIGIYATICEIRENGLVLQQIGKKRNEKFVFPLDCFIADNYQLSTDDYEIF